MEGSRLTTRMEEISKSTGGGTTMSGREWFDRMKTKEKSGPLFMPNLVGQRSPIFRKVK